MYYKEEYRGSKIILNFPTLTIIRDKMYDNFPEKEAIKWARKIMLKKENDYYDGFFITYNYPAYDDDGNEVDGYDVNILGTIPEHYNAEGIDDTIIQPKRSGQ
jgi:hypothetical protein